VAYPIDPGAHRIRAELGGLTYFAQTVMLVERDLQVVQIPPPPADGPRDVEEDLREEPPVQPTSSTPPWVIPTAFAAAGLGTATAVVSLVLGSKVQSDLDAGCPNNRCPEEFTDDLQTFHLYQALFISGAALGAAGLGVGLYFVFDDSSGGSVALGFDPNGTRVSGTF
jgi:hypothetical protein